MATPPRFPRGRIECACGNSFRNPYAWAVHALARVDLDSDPQAETAVNPFE